MRKLLILIITLILASPLYAYEMVLPKEKQFVTTDKYAFFVGKAGHNESIYINDEKIYIAPNGAFAHSVKLKNGDNRIALRSNYSMRIYKIRKNQPAEKIKPKLTEYPPELYQVINDNTPLRSTPIDYGMNRISHLFAGTKLIIDGEEGDFYRVFLSKDKIGWIDKNAIEKVDEDYKVSKFIKMHSKTYKNALLHTIKFSDKLPYTIEETDDEVLFRVYNPQASEDSVYTMNIKKPAKYMYKTTLKDGLYEFKVISLTVPEKSLENLNIFIDAGHGGNELGAVGCLGDNEKDINMKIANELKAKLSKMGANVFMSRECDGFVSLDDRVSMAKENNTDIFVSIHLNSIPDIKMDIHKNRGTSVYYYNPNSKALAESVLNSITNEIKTRDDGVRTASFAVIRPADYIGILIETAYMTNPLDSMIYKEADFPKTTANAIADGILNYVQSKK